MITHNKSRHGADKTKKNTERKRGNMRKRIDRAEHVEARLMTAAEVAKYLSLGLNNAVTVANEAGARRQFGKRVLYDRQAIDEYLNGMTEEGSGK